jgi:hypothetical protein
MADVFQSSERKLLAATVHDIAQFVAQFVPARFRGICSRRQKAVIADSRTSLPGQPALPVAALAALPDKRIDTSDSP